MLRIELQRVVALFPFPPPRVLSRLDRPYGIPVSVRVGVLAPVLFFFVLFYWHVPPALPLAVCLLHTGKLVVHGPTFIFYILFYFRSFSPRIACRGERGAPLFVPILLFLVFYRPADPWGSILFWYTFYRYVSL